MAPVVVAITAVGSWIAANAALAAVITVAVVSLYTVATMDIPKTPGTDPSAAKQTIRTPNQPCRGVFGTAMLGGPLVFAEEYLHKGGHNETYESCSWGGSTSDNTDHGGHHCTTKTRWVDTSIKWLHLVVVLANHRCHSVPEVYFGDEKQTNWDHEYWKIHVLTGSQNKISDLPSMLTAVPSWTNKMIGKGLTYVHIALRHSAKHFPNGIPGIKCLVKGQILDTPFYKGFGNNAAACIYHYLRHDFGATEKMINTASFTNEFQVCNEVIPSESSTNIPTPIRYAIDGAYDYDESHDNVLKKMLSACGGNLIFTNGQYHLQVAAYRGPLTSKQVISLSDLNGPVNIIPETALSDRVNTIRGQYLEPSNGYLQADFTPVTSAAYVAEDGGERTYDADLEYVINKHQAHRLANIILKDNRYGLTMRVPMNLRGFKFNAGLLVGFDEKTLGYDDLEFRVTSWKLDPKGGVELVLKQTAADIYDDSTAPVQTKPVDSQLPDPKFCYPVEHLTFDVFEDDGVYDGMLWWSHPDLANIREFEIVATSTGGEIFRVNVGKDTEYRLQNMRGVEYRIVVTAYNRYGAPSSPVAINTKVGEPKPITGVVFEPDNFEVTIRPLVSGVLPQNTRFSFFRSTTPVPDETKLEYIGEGVTFTDVGLKSGTTYHYYVQPLNSSAMGDLFGPYGTQTTDNPDDIYDLIKDEIPGTYTWVVYATDAFGAGLSKTFNPAIHTYEGRAYNKSVEEPSTNPLDYTFFRIGEFISDAEQDILDNLAQGKLPDGSDKLVKPSDVLFKPGDAAQDIIANLEQGKLPDGSADLVKPDDVLFKPGDPAQDIIKNLEQGKLPDGSADLVKPDDVLFGPGDKVQGTNIANGSISTEKLKANAVTADKIKANTITAAQIKAGAVTATEIAANTITAAQIKAGTITADELSANAVTADKIKADSITTAKIKAGAVTATEIAANTITAAQIKAGVITATELSSNSVTADKIKANSVTTAKIDAGAVTATEIAANAVTADKILANSISANKIQAGAITAEKLAVTVVSPVNNYSEFSDTRGWSLPAGASLVEEAVLEGHPVVTVKVVSGTGERRMSSDKFNIDPNSIYEVRFSIYCDQTTAAVASGFAAIGYDKSDAKVQCETFHPETLQSTGTSDNPEFWQGNVVNGWRHMVCYIVGANADVASCAKSLNVNAIIKLPSNARKAQLTNWVDGSGNVRAVHFYSPSVIKVGSGLIVANEIKAGAKIVAPIIEGGTIKGGRIEGTTGYFEGDVEAGRVVGVVGSASKAQSSQVVWSARRSTNPNYKRIARLKVKREHFARRVTVRVQIDHLLVTGNYPYGVRDDFPHVARMSDCTRLVPRTQTISPAIKVNGFRVVYPDRVGYQGSNSQTSLLCQVIEYSVDLAASAKGDNTVDYIPLYLGFNVSARAPHTQRYAVLLGGTSITATTTKNQSSDYLNVLID